MILLEANVPRVRTWTRGGRAAVRGGERRVGGAADGAGGSRHDRNTEADFAAALLRDFRGMRGGDSSHERGVSLGVVK